MCPSYTGHVEILPSLAGGTVCYTSALTKIGYLLKLDAPRVYVGYCPFSCNLSERKKHECNNNRQCKIFLAKQNNVVVGLLSSASKKGTASIF